MTQVNLKKTEKDSIIKSDRILVSSCDNLNYFQSLYPEVANIDILHGYVSDIFFSSQWSFDSNRTCRLLFVGFLGYPPNILAVRYIIEEILPQLRKKMTEFEFVICGGQHEVLCAEFSTVPNVTFKGYVKDIISECLNASLFLSP